MTDIWPVILLAVSLAFNFVLFRALYKERCKGREEMIRVIAIAAVIIECLDRRTGNESNT